jgi:hypothetical protein
MTIGAALPKPPGQGTLISDFHAPLEKPEGIVTGGCTSARIIKTFIKPRGNFHAVLGNMCEF